MKKAEIIITTALAVVIGLALAGCAAGSGSSAAAEPTMTAIPLPTMTATRLASAATASPTVASPTQPPIPTTTPSQPPAPTPTPSQPPAPRPTPTKEPTATPKPTRSQPRPTATPQFSGKLVFQTTLGGDFYTINADGADSSGSLRRITDGIDPVWSPDGEQIAFTRWREPRGVWLVDADGSDERLVFDWSEARWPSWSPDGSRILFSRQHGGRMEEKEKCFWGRCFTIPPRLHWKLGIVNAGDGTFAEPPGPDIAQAPDWSPDGTRFVYDGEHGLVVQSLDGTISYEITDSARDTSPVWSPGGSQVAFTRHQHDHWEVYVVGADGRNLRRLTDTPTRPDSAPGSSASPAWSPDGKYIAFLTDRTGQWEIWVMEADGNSQRPMFGSALDGVTLEYTFQGERAISWRR